MSSEPLAAAEIERVVVVGGGLMGSGIAQVLAGAGLEVAVVDVSEEALESTRARIERSVGRFVESGRMSGEDADELRSRLSISTDFEHR